MASRFISVEDLESFFNIDKVRIDEYFENKIKERYVARRNNYPSSICSLLDAYTKGYSDFKEQLDSLHQEIILELSNHIDVDNESDDEIANKIFSTNNDEVKYQLIAARRSLERVYAKLIQENMVMFAYNTQKYEGSVHLYSKIHFDAKSLFGRCSRRTQQSADLDIFNFSRELLGHYFAYNMPVIPSTVILIRQSIETKLLQTFGVARFVYEGNNSRQAIVNVSKLLEFCKSLETQKKMSFPVTVELISKINKWCNHYVHTGNFSFHIWEIEWAHYVLAPLFKGGQDMTLMALDRSIFIDKKYFDENFYNELENFISTKIKVKKIPHKFLFKDAP